MELRFTPLDMRTYSEWQAARRQVIRGERAIGRRDGVALFSFEQTADADELFELDQEWLSESDLEVNGWG